MSSNSFELNKNILLRAGAGAGKTTTLIEVFFKFTEQFKIQNGRMPRIAITTFTRKATQEIKERLLKVALDKGSPEMFQFVSSKSSVQISTIHGLLSKFLSQCGSDLGMTPDFQILSPSDAEKISRGLISSLFKEMPKFCILLETMDFNQIQKIVHSAFENKIQFPQSKFVNSNIQLNMAERDLKKLGEKMISICEEFLYQTQEEKYVSYYNTIRNWDWELQHSELFDFINQASSFFSQNSKPRLSKNAYDSLLDDQFNECKKELVNLLDNESLNSEFLKNHDLICSLFSELNEIYSQKIVHLKLSTGMMTMSDLELISLLLIKESPSAAEAFSKSWDYWMVDEYQDTSPLQVELLKALIGEGKSFTVGDPQQSIYLFRGARSEIFHSKHEEIVNKNDYFEFRRDNWRSTPEVLGFLNYFFNTFNSADFSSMTTQKEKTDPEQIVAEIICVSNQDKPQEDGNELDRQESLIVTERVQNLLLKGVLPETICILGRTNKIIEAVSSVLIEHSIPVCVHSAGGFFSRREVLDALSIAKFILNPHDNLNLLILLRSPWFFIPDSEIGSFCHKKHQSLWKSLNEESHTSIIRLKGHLQEAHRVGFGFAFKSALIQCGIFESALRLDPSGQREANLWKLVSLINDEERRPGFNFLKILEKGMASLDPDEGGIEGDAIAVIEPKRVNLMTIHASKGLQFDHVFIVGMSNRGSLSKARLFLSDEQTGDWTLQLRDEDTQVMKTSYFGKAIVTSMRTREEKESDRILYVAMTRAKQSLTLIYKEKYSKGSWAEKLPLFGSPGNYKVEFDGIPFSYCVKNEVNNPVKCNFEQNKSENFLSEVYKFCANEKNNNFDKTKILSVTDLIESNYLVDHPKFESKNQKKQDILTSIEKTHKGILAHSLFEKLKYFSLDQIGKDLSDEDKIMINYLLNLSEIPIKELLKFGFAEWAFTLKKSDYLIQGQIDLWGEINDTIWVLDYKTGSSKYSEKGFAQLKIYAQALRELGFIQENHEVRLVLIYPIDQNFEIRKERAFEGHLFI